MPQYYLNIRSRHETHDVLRQAVRLPFRTIVRLGSTTVLSDYPRIECNTVEAVRNSANKLRMKNCFRGADIKTANWWTLANNGNFTNQQDMSTTRVEDLPFPIVAKHLHGSRGEGNTILHTLEELRSWLPGKTNSNYIFEQFYNFSKEFRIHVTKDGAFYCIQKKLKRDTPMHDRWARHDDNSVWITEYQIEKTSTGQFLRFLPSRNPEFDVPINWETIKTEAVAALRAVGLDIGAIDVKVQSNTQNGRPRGEVKYIILETNSAPSFGTITGKLYKDQIIKILREKQNS